MRALLISLVPLISVALGCDDSTTSETPVPTTSRKNPSKAGESEMLPRPTGRVAELVKSLQSTDRQVAFEAATQLGEMQFDAIAAIPALVDLATFDEKGSHTIHPTLAAGEALRKISADAAVPYLIKSLEQAQRRYWAARILGEFGPTARPAIPALVDAMRAVKNAQTDDGRAASAQAAAALAGIRPHGLSALISEMTHDDSNVRKLAVWATPRGQDGKPAVNMLAARLSDEDADMRSIAANALADIGPDATDALPFIEIALNEERSDVVVFALHRALESIGRSPNDNK